MYSHTDLKWVKNVKRNKGTSWAYDNLKTGDAFYLNWSKKFKGNVLKAPIGDLILIFQTVNNPKGSYLTHIVTPLDNKIVIDNSSTHPFTRLVGLVALADPIDSIPKPKDLDFFRPNRGASCYLETIKELKTKKDIPLLTLQRRFWGMFHQKEAELQNLFTAISNETREEDEFEEGKELVLMRKHKFYERSREVVILAKENAKRENRLFCEVCNFDFSAGYPNHGNGFIECHHKTFLSTGIIRKTTVKDLAMVCANCHRMLHRKNKLGVYYTVEELSKEFF